MNATVPAARVMLDDLGPYDAESVIGACPNGWALPCLSPDTVRRLAADLEGMRRWNFDTLSFDGLVVEVHDGDPGDNETDPVIEVCEPRHDGTYAIGHGYWTWSLLPDEPELTGTGDAPDALPA
ncbi:hypothetical protein ACFWA9_29210 [Kitasatospora sp. NPDC059973]|uniref:hypothetical protein n=1 Tax=Kitasatospora sp. NPDC059973 TaxID=3347020 RepID=UPI0036C2FFF0